MPERLAVVGANCAEKVDDRVNQCHGRLLSALSLLGIVQVVVVQVVGAARVRVHFGHAVDYVAAAPHQRDGHAPALPRPLADQLRLQVAQRVLFAQLDVFPGLFECYDRRYLSGQCRPSMMPGRMVIRPPSLLPDSWQPTQPVSPGSRRTARCGSPGKQPPAGRKAPGSRH